MGNCSHAELNASFLTVVKAAYCFLIIMFQQKCYFVFRVLFESIEEYWTSDVDVNFMQEDMHREGHIIMTTRDHGIGTLSPSGQFTVNVSFDDLYRNDIGRISSFMQHNATMMILVDEEYNCLRWLNRETDEIEPMAGRCRLGKSPESLAGSDLMEVRFNKPMIIAMGRNNQEYYLTEDGNGTGAVTHLKLSSASTMSFLNNDFMQGRFENPQGIVHDEQTKKLYISFVGKIFYIDLDDDAANYGSGFLGHSEDPLATTPEYVLSGALTVVAGRVLVALPNDDNSALHLIDLDTKRVSLHGIADRDATCLLTVPSQKKLYIGGRDGISVISYDCEYRGRGMGCGIIG